MVFGFLANCFCAPLFSCDSFDFIILTIVNEIGRTRTTRSKTGRRWIKWSAIIISFATSTSLLIALLRQIRMCTCTSSRTGRRWAHGPVGPALSMLTRLTSSTVNRSILRRDISLKRLNWAKRWCAIGPISHALGTNLLHLLFPYFSSHSIP